MKRANRKRIFVAAQCTAAFVIIAFLSVLEPFAPRFQGKTVHQWLLHHQDEIPSAPRLSSEMIDHFGSSALPALQKAGNHARFLWEFRRSWPRCAKFLSPILESYEDHARRRASVASHWSIELR